MAWLLIDNSNTRTKFAVGDEAGLHDWRGMIPTVGLNQESLGTVLSEIQYDAVVVASVVPEKVAMLTGYFKESRFHSLTWRSPLGFGFELPNLEQIGNDRLANVAALKRNYGSPAIAVDFGTAVTFSVLSAAGNFSGGAIAPGMAAMTEYLATHTAQLPRITHSEPRTAIGTNTAEALLSGAVHGHRGMVQGILRNIIAETDGSPRVIATGGGAEFGAKGVAEFDHIDPELTLEGLRLVACDVFM